MIRRFLGIAGGCILLLLATGNAVREGGLARFYREAQRATLDGIEHFLGGWVHLAFLAVVCLVGGLRKGIWLATAAVCAGTVTHFGHRHFRQNRYDARVSLVPDNDIWKIQGIELFDEERLR